MYAYLDENHSDERKEGQTEEQFYYKTRKRAIGPFKDALWGMSGDALSPIESAWEAQFRALFERLNVINTRKMVESTVDPVIVQPDVVLYLSESAGEEDVSDLAD
jgi:hypothetical protein